MIITLMEELHIHTYAMDANIPLLQKVIQHWEDLLLEAF